MTAQQARTITVVQTALAVMVAVNLVADFRWDQWQISSDGVNTLLMSMLVLTWIYQTRLRTGEWVRPLLWMVAAWSVLGVLQLLP